jgi:hypothetical protein
MVETNTFSVCQEHQKMGGQIRYVVIQSILEYPPVPPSLCPWRHHSTVEMAGTELPLNMFHVMACSASTIFWHKKLARASAVHRHTFHQHLPRPPALCSPMASDQEINKRLRSLHQDFDFLLDNNIISTQLYDDLVAKIPRRKFPLPQHQSAMQTDSWRLSWDETGLCRIHDHDSCSCILCPHVATLLCECDHLAVECDFSRPRRGKIASASANPEHGTALVRSCTGRSVVRLHLHGRWRLANPHRTTHRHPRIRQ